MNGGSTHNERKFKSEMSMDEKHDEFNLVHIEFKFISEIIYGDFYQRVSYLSIKFRVRVWTAVKFLEGIEYK